MKFTVHTTLLVLASTVGTFAAPLLGTRGSSIDVPNADVSQTSGGIYTVIVDNDDPRTLSQLIAEAGIDRSGLKHIYNNTAFKGFSGKLSSTHLDRMSVMAGFKTLEPEVEITTADVQNNAPWGLQRISEGGEIRDPPTDPSTIREFNFNYQFDGPAQDAGKDVDIYVIDTGINVEHVDFGGRAKFGFSVDNQDVDNEGHGTHCAGTAGSNTFGIAKGANIIAVKVFREDGGKSSDILQGIDWVIQNHDMRKTQDDWAGSVASMSLGSDLVSNSLDEAVRQASANGIHFSVAAGNAGKDACHASPSAATAGSSVIAVGAITIDDQRATFSNFGRCTTVYAPGVDITSTWIGGDNVLNTISGTSMATPHVSGLIAYTLSQDPSLKTDTQGMKDFIVSSSTDLSVEVPSDTGFSTTQVVKVVNNGFRKQTQKTRTKRSFRRA